MTATSPSRGSTPRRARKPLLAAARAPAPSASSLSKNSKGRPSGRQGDLMSDLVNYKNKRVIVSGCFSGMGEATARQLIGLGAEVHGLDFKPSTLDLASFNQVDLRDPASIEAAVAKVG